MLEALVLTVLVFVVLSTVLMIGGLIAASVSLQRSNRVHPDVDSAAPTLWLWSPAAPARLHRRLRAAVAPVAVPVEVPKRRRRSRQHTPGPYDDIARELGVQAIEIDRHVCLAARLPRPQRRRALAELTPQVYEVERLSVQLVSLRRASANPAGTPIASPPEVLADLGHRLDLLHDAHDDLRAIEASNGLGDPDLVLRRAEALPTARPDEAMLHPEPPAAGPGTLRG